MAGIPSWVYARLGQTITVESYLGVVGGDDAFGAVVNVRAVVEETTATDRAQTPTDDTQVMATARMALATDCPAGSRITLASGLRGVATKVVRWDGRSTAAPSHLEVQMSATADAPA
jgi:hypothetical protein